MAEVQLKKMGITHEAVMDWLLLNPEKTQGQCAEYFGITEQWLSVVVNSDCFQARLRERRMLMDHRVTDITEGRLKGVIQKGLERLEQMVETVPDPRFVLDTTDKMLARLGYGPKSGPAVVNNTQNNTYVISKDVLARARNEIRTVGEVGAQEMVEEQVVEVLPPPSTPAAPPPITINLTSLKAAK